MNKKIKLLYVAAEISPYAHAGGLGEVGRSLPKALVESGDIEVRRVMPLHRSVDQTMKYVTDFPVAMDRDYETCVVKMDAQSKDIPTYFIENDRYYYRDNLYGYEDDGLRYFFFCKAVIEMLRRIPYKPDIVHTNDWHTGFLPLLLKKEFPNIKSVYTIHNISYQGFISPDYFKDTLSIKEQYALGWPEWLNFMKAGIIYSDLLTTVSPGYCEEVSQPAFGYGMTPLIEQRAKGMVGILNGVDTQSYDPSQEGVLEFPYNRENLEQKKRNRFLLRQNYGLPDTEKPLVAIITRLDYYKGIDTIIKAISYFDFSKFQLFILGSGSSYYQELLANIAEGYSESIAVDFEYTEVLAKKVYAAADIYLMPSLFEPCGLGQQFAMRYGVVPIVNPVGGLKDTVVDDEENPDNHTGFYMEEWNGKALNDALNRAIKAYHSPVWDQYMKNCMDYDSSWKRSVAEYINYFSALLSSK